MKKIVKCILAITLFAGFASCEDEQDLVYSTPEGSFDILSPVSGEGIVLSPDTPTNPGLSLTWSAMDYGTPTQVIYEVQVDKSGDDFDTPVTLTSTTNTYASVTSDALNGAAVGAGLTPFTQGGLEIRIRATVGTTGSQESFSTVITYLVTAYSTSLPRIAVPGNHQGWNPPTAPVLASSAFGETDYEGYVWLDGAFKFLSPDAAGNFNWGTQDWGDDGTFSGVLKDGTGETDALAPVAGYYRVKADTDALTYSIQPTNWGLIGDATPTGWGSDTDMVYDPATKTLKLSTTLTAGLKIKFRANDDWALNYGDSGADGTLNEGGDDIVVGTGGSVTVTLDLSNPREYTYSITPN